MHSILYFDISFEVGAVVYIDYQSIEFQVLL